VGVELLNCWRSNGPDGFRGAGPQRLMLWRHTAGYAGNACTSRVTPMLLPGAALSKLAVAPGPAISATHQAASPMPPMVL
jgi:hypothetical protein